MACGPQPFLSHEHLRLTQIALSDVTHGSQRVKTLSGFFSETLSSNTFSFSKPDLTSQLPPSISHSLAPEISLFFLSYPEPFSSQGQGDPTFSGDCLSPCMRMTLCVSLMLSLFSTQDFYLPAGHTWARDSA